MKVLISRVLLILFLILSVISFPITPAWAVKPSSDDVGKCEPGLEGKKAGNPIFKRQPLRFERNAGQTDRQARFLARSADSTLFLTTSEAVLQLPELAKKPAAKSLTRRPDPSELTKPTAGAAIRLRPVKANAQPRLVGLDRLPGVSNYFLGNEPRKWRTNIESYAKVKYENLYPGIDLVYYGNEAGEIEYDFVVAPGADPDRIALSIEGAESIDIDRESGDLLLATTVGRLRQHAPRIYQESNEAGGARREIAGRYKLKERTGQVAGLVTRHSSPVAAEIAFELGDYDESRPLVIDPVVVYSTLLGGASANFDGASDVAVDAQGNAYIAGQTDCSDFPTRNALDSTPPQRFLSKAFISKFAPDGTLIYSTFLGGADGNSNATALAVDATGAVYLTGGTNPGFPLVNAFQSAAGSFADAFIAKLNPQGTAILFSSFLGGNQPENAKHLKLDAQNNVYILGEIQATGGAVTFPTVGPTQANYGGGQRDMFISKVAANGARLIFSTFLGGNGDEEASSLSVPPAGSPIVISGGSDSTNIAARDSAGQVFTTSCDELNAFLYVLYGGSGEGGDIRIILEFADYVKWLENRHGEDPTCAEKLEFLYGIAGGTTQSLRALQAQGPTIPTGSVIANGAYPTAGGFDVVVAAIDQNGNGKAQAIFGGSRDEFISRSVIDSRGAIYVTGDTTSTDLPTVGPTQGATGGTNNNGFVVVFAPNTFSVLFATYLGGDGFTLPESITVDPLGNFYVAGIVTIGTAFPTTPGAFQRDLKGRNDAFLVKYSPVDIQIGPDFTLSFPNPTVTATTGKTKIAASINRSGGFSGNVTITPVNFPPGIIFVNESASTTGASVNFKLKIKAGAARGTHQLTLAAKDDSGKTRNATLTLNLQ